MSKVMSKAAALMIVTAMIFSLFGCGGKDTAKDTSKSLNTGSTASTAETEKSKDPVTLKLFGPVFYGGPWQNGEQTDPIAQAVKNDTGITMDVENMDENYDAKLGAMIASGDLPDIVGFNSTKYFKNLIENKQIIEMDNLLATDGQNVTKYAQRKIDFSRKFLSNETGKLFVLPSNLADDVPANVYSPFWAIRWDLYKQLGYPQYKNMDEFLGVLKKMQDMEPMNSEGKKNYAISQWMADWNLWPFTFLSDNSCQYSELPGGFLDVDNETLEAKSFILSDDSGYWSTMKLYYNANKLGILDPESVTQNYDQATNKGSANRILAAPFDWPLTGGRAAFRQAGQPEKDYVNAPPPSDFTRIRNGDLNYYGNMNEMYVISSNCKNPDRAMDLINWFHLPENCTNVMNGMKGDTWNIVDGKPKLTDEYYTETTNNWDTYTVGKGINKYGGFKGLDGGYKSPEYEGIYLDLNYLPESDMRALNPKENPSTADFVQHYNVQFPRDIYKGKRIPWNSAIIGLMPDAPDDIKLIDSNIKTYLQTSSPKLALAKDDAAFSAAANEIKEKCKAMGLEKTTEFWLKELKNVAEKLKTLK